MRGCNLLLGVCSTFNVNLDEVPLCLLVVFVSAFSFNCHSFPTIHS